MAQMKRRSCLSVLRIAAVLMGVAMAALPRPVSAEMLAVSQYGRVTATLPWAIAMNKGMFKDAGLDIDQISPGTGGGTSVRNMLAGDLPYAEVATSAALAAIRSGIDVVIVNTASDHIGEISLAVMPASPIHELKDLAGRKLGYTGPKSTSEMLMRMVLQKAGLTDKAQLISTGGFGPGLTALSLNAIDAAPLNDPILTLTPDKYRTIFAFADMIPRATWLVGISTSEFAHANPAKLRALIAVRRKAVDYIYAHPDEAAAVYAQVWDVPPADAAKLLPKYFHFEGEWSRGDFNKSGLDAMSTGLQLIGDITAPVDWSKVIDQSFLPADLPRQ